MAVIALPRVVQRPSPNYSAVPIRHDLLVTHMEEGGSAGSEAWLADPRAEAAPHVAINEIGDRLTQFVPLQFKAWAQCAFNSAGLSLEIPGFTAQGIPDARWQAAALIWGWASLVYDIPPVWVPNGLGRGICQHADLGAAGGGHHDACGVGSPTWMKFLGYVQSARDELKTLPSLPTLALHGLPGPADVSHEVSIVTPTPSHGGAARNEPGDTHNHATVSGYPAHSVAALQADLRALGEPVDVDGWFGVQTQGALRAFQMKHGLTPDAIPGPASWRALDDAMAKTA